MELWLFNIEEPEIRHFKSNLSKNGMSDDRFRDIVDKFAITRNFKSDIEMTPEERAIGYLIIITNQHVKDVI